MEMVKPVIPSKSFEGKIQFIRARNPTNHVEPLYVHVGVPSRHDIVHQNSMQIPSLISLHLNTTCTWYGKRVINLCYVFTLPTHLVNRGIFLPVLKNIQHTLLPRISCLICDNNFETLTKLLVPPPFLKLYDMSDTKLVLFNTQFYNSVCIHCTRKGQSLGVFLYGSIVKVSSQVSR